jgi:hypothetical protein
MLLRVDHTLRRQLADRGPWVFWREAPGASLKEGIVAMVQTCGNEECTCREVTLSVVPAAANLVEVALDDRRGRLALGYPGDTGAAAPDNPGLRADVDVDIDTGEVRARGTASEEVIEWLRGEIDGPLLERLHDRWMAAKRLRRCKEFVAGKWVRQPRGLMIAYAEPFPDQRQDIYLLDGAPFLADDQYCIEPSCDCGEVRVAFVALAPSSGEAFVGSVSYDMAQCQPLETEVGPRGRRDRVERLWDAFSRRHPLPSFFEKRMRRMKAVGRALKRDNPSAAPLKLGRNDPCPCGSGRKYKKCCMVGRR